MVILFAVLSIRSHPFALGLSVAMFVTDFSLGSHDILAEVKGLVATAESTSEIKGNFAGGKPPLHLY